MHALGGAQGAGAEVDVVPEQRAGFGSAQSEHDSLAEMHAKEIVRKMTIGDGSLNSPMRNAEAQLTLGVVDAKRGDVEQALTLGRDALSIGRKSGPSLLMVGSELDEALRTATRMSRPSSSSTRSF